MAAAPKVSVMIISYNQEAYIAQAIESAAAQDYPNLEVVVSDDGSSDRTPDIIREFARRYPNRVVPVLNPVNQGITRNSNAGLRACTGKYIAFQGGDDILLPGKIRAQVAWLEADPARVLCGHQVEVFYEDGSRPPHPLSRRLEAGSGAGKIIRDGTFGATAVMVRADKIPPHGFEEALPVVSDHMLWVEVLADGGDFGYIEGTWARYRRHSANVTNDPLRSIPEVSKYLDIVAERYPQYRSSCRYARVRRIYDAGVALLRAGRRREARERFFQAIRREPLFLKAWVRAAQSLG
jgi:glycosyltransferase involved in cell wall biosynthesis